MARRLWVLVALLVVPADARADDKPDDKTLVGGLTNAVHVVAFSPDGKTLASADDDGVITLWDVATRKARARMEMPEKFVRALAYSPDGKTVASGDKKKNVQLWDAATGKAVGASLDQGRSVWALAFSPDGKTLASAGNGARVRLWDVATRKESAFIDLPNAVIVHRLAFSPTVGGQLVAEAAPVRLCAVDKAREYANLQGMSPAYSPDGKTLAVQWVKGIHLRDLEAGKDRLTIALPQFLLLKCITFAPDGKALAGAGDDNTVRLWDAETGKELAVFKHAGRVWSVAFSPDGKTVASGSDDKTVRLWDVPAPR
jgi:WD40 repeat protein